MILIVLLALALPVGFIALLFYIGKQVAKSAMKEALTEYFDEKEQNTVQD